MYLSICRLENEAILREFLNFWTWQHQKRDNSARTPQFSKLTTSKATKTICETSLKHGKLSAELTASCHCLLRFCLSICLKCCACHKKLMPDHAKCCTCHAKSSSQKLKIWCSKMQPLLGNQRPDLLTLMNMSLVLRLPRKMHLCRSSWNVPRMPSFLEMPQNPHVLLTFNKVHNPLRLPRETTSERPKVVRTCSAFIILTSKRSSRHNGVRFLTSQLLKAFRTWCVL